MNFNDYIISRLSFLGRQHFINIYQTISKLLMIKLIVNIESLL
jgi:hypothetical protein